MGFLVGPIKVSRVDRGVFELNRIVGNASGQLMRRQRNLSLRVRLGVGCGRQIDERPVWRLYLWPC